MDRRLQERPRVQPHQAAIAALARRQQHDSRRRRGQRVARVGILIAEIDREFAADDRLDAVARHLVGEFQRPEHVVGVGQRQRRLAVGFRQFAELGDLDRALQQRIGRMNVEMNESGTGHGRLRALASWWERSSAAHARQLASAMVMPWPCGVHAERAPRARHPAFPQGPRRHFGAAHLPARASEAAGISCAQTAIIPTNSVIDASAAASSTNNPQHASELP